MHRIEMQLQWPVEQSQYCWQPVYPNHHLLELVNPVLRCLLLNPLYDEIGDGNDDDEYIAGGGNDDSTKAVVIHSPFLRVTA